MAKSKAGGGYRSKQVKNVGVRTGQRAEEIRPAGVSQIGSSIGNKAMGHAGILKGGVEPVRGQQRGPTQPGGFPLGNTIAAATVCGPGGSREVMRSGSQSQHGPVNPGQPTPGAGKPIFPGFR
jgi:hypothetical protein